MSRRNFLKQSAGATGGLVLGFHLPLMGQRALAQVPQQPPCPPEINAWVVIQPDDRVVIRIARSEMGRARSPASRSSLPKSWNVTGQRSPPNTRHRARTSSASAWGDFSTGGSRGIRQSHDYVRRAAPPHAWR